ncbi:unnamed protein product, partial [Rotaria socialis]
MSNFAQSTVTKHAKIKAKIEGMYSQFENGERRNGDPRPLVTRNVLFFGLSMSGKTTIRRVLVDPRIIAEESTLQAESQTDAICERNVNFRSFNMTVNMVELPANMINGTLSLSSINEKCTNFEIQDFHLICLCISIAAGIDGTAIEAFERLIRHLNQDKVRPNLCLIITRCESKDDAQREKLRNALFNDVGSRFIARHLGREAQFFGALNHDDWSQANTSLLQQFNTIYNYRQSLLQLIRTDIPPFHVPVWRYSQPLASTTISRRSNHVPVHSSSPGWRKLHDQASTLQQAPSPPRTTAQSSLYRQNEHERSPSGSNNQQSLTTSDNVLQQITSPNSIPIIPPLDTIQSNSTSVTPSSISKSTEDDETCDENIIEQPSSLKTKRGNFISEWIQADSSGFMDSAAPPLYFTPLSYKDQYKSHEQAQILGSIRRIIKNMNHIIRVTDKGNNFYIGSAELSYNPFNEILNKVIQLLNTLGGKDFIRKWQYEQMMPDRTKCELAHLYFNPKIHKDSIPVRPIENTIHALTTKISKFLDKILRPIFDDKSKDITIIDGASLITELSKYYKKGLLKPTTRSCTFDIRHLYTMLPQEETLDTLMTFLHVHRYRKVKGISIDSIKKLASIILKNNVFAYGKNIYKQTTGGAMGSSLTLTLANIFMSKCLPFLDVQFANNSGILSTSVYHKPAAKPYVTPFISDHPRHVFINIIQTSLARAVRYSSTFEAFNYERRYIKLMLLYNGYPSTFIENDFHKYLSDYISTSPFLPLIDNENKFFQLRQKLLAQPTSRQSQVALNAATTDIDNDPVADETKQPNQSPTKLDSTTITNYEEKLFLHYTHEKRFEVFKRDMHHAYEHKVVAKSLRT